MQKLLETSKLLEILDYNKTAIPQKFKITNMINNKLIINNDEEFFSLLNNYHMKYMTTYFYWHLAVYMKHAEEKILIV
jgi:hypothetical protein